MSPDTSPFKRQMYITVGIKYAAQGHCFESMRWKLMERNDRIHCKEFWPYLLARSLLANHSAP